MQADGCRTPVLRAQDLSKDYGARTALRSVSFDIAGGEVLGVLGANGAGKSTIVRIITGLLDPSEGKVIFRGAPIQDHFDEFRNALGYVPEQADLYGFLTGWEYVEMVAALRGLSRPVFRRRARALFEAFALSDARVQPIGSYSKGMRQRVVLIAALIHNPVFLVLDEPFSGLDVISSMVVRNLIGLMAQRGKAIFFSSPSLEHLEQVSTHLLLLRDGAVVASGSRADVIGQAGAAGVLQSTGGSDTNVVAESIMEAIGAT